MTDPLVSSQWLFENINNPDLIVLDASQKVDENNLQITGARYFDLKNNFSDKGSSLPNTFPNAAQFELESQKLGINHSSIIVVYDKEFKPRRIGGLSYRMRTGGIGAIIIGIYFIVLAFKNT